MARTKIDYGIDLGTTNSAIARMQNGEPFIQKSDTLKDTIPSCVGFNKKKSVLVGDEALNKLKSDKLKAMKNYDNSGYNTFIEFKRTMGTDKAFYSSRMVRDYNSENLSAEVLKKLRSFITDENFQSVVVTVPAKFDIPQMDATKRAAKLAGFKYCELLSEPIAASMAYGLSNKKKNGYWVVFDLGGGTFDAALVKVEEGIMKVVDTDGDNYLGGKNLDIAIVDEIIIPYLQDKNVIDSILENESKKQILQDAMKYYAEEAKIDLSFKNEHDILSDLGDIPGEDDEGEEFELDIPVNREILKKVIAPFFQRAIDFTKDLIERNNLSGGKLDTLILVGGPTYSPILREMLEEQIKKPDTSVDPMTAVAKGAALYASTIDVADDIIEASRDKKKIQLDIGYEPSTVETEEWVTIKTLPDKTEDEIPERVFAEIVRSDKAWSSGRLEINNNGEIIEVKLNDGKPNSFKVFLYDDVGNRLEGQPDNFTIICGISDGGGAAILNHSIGIEVDTGKPYAVFEPVKGLEKNVSIPATGNIIGLKTKSDMRPGKSDDKLRISLYQGEYDAIGSRAIYNKPIYDVIITGDDLSGFLPENSDVDLTIKTDRSSGRIEKLEAYFPYLDFTHEVPIPENPTSSITQERLSQDLESAEATIDRLSSNSLIDQNKLSEIKKEVSYQRERFDQGGVEIDRRLEVLGNLNEALRKADKLEDKIEWSSLEQELRDEFVRLEKANNDFGNEKTTLHVDEIRNQLDEVIRNQDVKSGRDLLEEISEIFVGLTLIYQLMGFVRYNSENFNSVDWKDPNHARHLINQAESIIANNPSVNELHPIVVQMADLIIDDGGQEIPDEILRKAYN